MAASILCISVVFKEIFPGNALGGRRVDAVRALDEQVRLLIEKECDLLVILGINSDRVCRSAIQFGRTARLTANRSRAASASARSKFDAYIHRIPRDETSRRVPAFCLLYRPDFLAISHKGVCNWAPTRLYVECLAKTIRIELQRFRFVRNLLLPKRWPLMWVRHFLNLASCSGPPRAAIALSIDLHAAGSIGTDILKGIAEGTF